MVRIKLSSSRSLAVRYVSWLDRHRIAVFLASLVVVAIGALCALRLPLRSDLSTLLPPSKRSVQDLEQLRHRARSFGNVLIMVDAPSPELRERAAGELEARLRAIDPELVISVSTDDNAAARYGWAHRFLFAELSDLRDARDALADRLRRARLDANPLYIDLDDSPAESSGVSASRLEDLQRRLDEAERAATSTPIRLSPDGKSQLFALQVTFPSSDITRGRMLMGIVRGLGAELAQRHPGVVVEFAGNVNFSIFEHDSVISGMALAAVVTIVLVFGGLFLYYRAVIPVLGALWALIVGVSVTLTFAYAAIGHLNLLSAFLTAIVIGNGINPGLIILARYFEEIRRDISPRDAIAPALRGSLHGTLGASLTAAVAYGALAVTDFRGFRHFGIIGGVGMLLCWISSYTVLPALLSVLERRGLVRPTAEPALGRLLGRLT
ncbi:MAG: MMPL family transporter, partial [Kofleriaceae bacterium]